eukprot:250199-Prymnesium_polylepis.1
MWHVRSGCEARRRSLRSRLYEPIFATQQHQWQESVPSLTLSPPKGGLDGAAAAGGGGGSGGDGGGDVGGHTQWFQSWGWLVVVVVSRSARLARVA